jgi:MoaA/NifB/PqqE/SkfB family radical SAM enzyme
MKQVPPGPWKLSVMLGWKCNANCIFCLRTPDRLARTKPMVDLPFSELDAMLLHFKPTMRCLEVCAFGETLLYPEFSRIVPLLKARHPELAQFSVTTNGSLMDRHLDLLTLPGLLTFSVDTTDAAMYADMRRGLDYAKVEANMRLAARSPRHARRKIGVNMAVFERNISSIYPMAQLIAPLGFSYLCLIVGAKYEGNIMQDEPLSSTDSRVLAEVRRCQMSFPGLSLASDWFDLPGATNAHNVRCTNPWVSLDVDMDGIAHPCCRSYGTSLGPWRQNAWRHSTQEKLRQQIEARKIDPVDFPECAKCPWK